MIYIYNEQIKLDGYVAMVLEAQLNSLLVLLFESSNCLWIWSSLLAACLFIGYIYWKKNLRVPTME